MCFHRVKNLEKEDLADASKAIVQGAANYLGLDTNSTQFRMMWHASKKEENLRSCMVQALRYKKGTAVSQMRGKLQQLLCEL